MSTIIGPNGESCGRCYFFEVGDNGYGYCHRYPPTRHPDEDCCGEPVVTESMHWCGEFKPQLKDEPASETPLQTLGLSGRASKALLRQEIYTVEQLTAKREDELVGWKNLGILALKEIKDKLSKRGLSLKYSVPAIVNGDSEPVQ